MMKKPTSKKTGPILGHLYAIPLLTKTYAVGWIRAMGTKAHEPMLIVVFNNVFATLPTENDLLKLSKQDIFNFYFVGKEGINLGIWKDCGEHPTLQTSSWKIPPVCEGLVVRKRSVIQYDDSLKITSTKPASADDLATYPKKPSIGHSMLLRTLTLRLDDDFPSEIKEFQSF